MNKRGKIEIKEIIEVLLAAACVTLLIILMIRVFSPTISVSELAAKNYLESLEIALDEAKETGSSEFLMYSSEPNPYFLVYLGEGYSFDKGFKIGVTRIIFKPQKARKNNLCVCYLEGDYSIENILDLEKGYICKYCIQEEIENSKEFFGYRSGKSLLLKYLPDSKEYQINDLASSNIQENIQKLIEAIKERNKDKDLEVEGE
jgi:hypothetical protein